MLETRQMPPPDDAEAFPSDAERAAAAAWIRSVAARVRSGARRRAGTRHGPAADERRVRLRHPRSDGHGHQDRRRRLQRRRRRRRLRQLRRRAVRAGRLGRALSRSEQAGRRTRGDRKSVRWRSIPIPARPASSCRRSTGSNSSTRRAASAWCREKADARSASIATRRRSTSPGTTVIARALGEPDRDAAGPRGAGRHHRTVRRAHLAGGQSSGRRLSEHV